MKSSLIQLGGAVVACLAVLIGYGFWYGIVADTSEMVRSLESQMSAEHETTSQALSNRAALATIVADEALVQSYFVSEDRVATFINDLEARGRAQGAVVTTLSVASSATNTKSAVSTRSTLTLTLTIKGTFDAVVRTVGAIEYAPYELSVSALTLAQDDVQLWHADLKLSVGSTPIATAPIRP